MPMLKSLNPGKVSLRDDQYVPPFLSQLVDAAAKGADLKPIVEAITRHLGFDSFMYAASAMPKPDHEEKAYVFTTLPFEWVARYDQSAYVEVDPRIQLTWDSAVPLVWDQGKVRNRSAKCDAFLDDARAHGIASGVCFMFHGPHDSHVLVALNSSIPHIDEVRLQAITRNLPDILMFGHYFHEIFMRSVIEIGTAPRSAGAPLSKRERECLIHAAHGLTTEDIAEKLAITPRTIQFHFDSIRSKLSAANRQEAIARAYQAGIIS
jgi:LuxR family transcriptional regulator, activator of conjugal transfer of Ti plasmids